MSKKRRINEYAKRLKNKQRMREKRQKQAIPTDVSRDQSFQESTVSCVTVDGAVSAPPGNFPGQVPMGFPQTKPLARMQASPCEKMYPTALSNASSQGSRLCAQNGGMAPSPDSPPWVCTSPRVPELNTVQVFNSAGQAQLGMSSPVVGDESSRILIDAPGILTSTHKYTESDIYENEHDTVFEKYDDNGNGNDGDVDGAGGGSVVYDINNDRSTRNKVCVCLQGDFHQAYNIFGENAGTQCVANCLAALAFHKLKITNQWDRTDMNKVLMTGNELYAYLQRSSTIANRYLLVEELPQFFECFDQTFEFKIIEPLPSLINLGSVEPNYEEFNAYPLLEALQIALAGTDGCFVSFCGNTFLIGRTVQGFFTFDSHSRSSKGYLIENGKSTRIMYMTIQELFHHVYTLAKSMGCSETTQCEITGVKCSLVHFQCMEVSAQTQSEDDKHCEIICDGGEYKNDILENVLSSTDDDDSDVIYDHTENRVFSFLPLLETKKQQLCQLLGIVCSLMSSNDTVQNEENMDRPIGIIEIDRDGNCFFKAVSFTLTGVQDFHREIRLAICNHLLQNQLLFKPFLRNEDCSVENYISSTCMIENGTWATEIEILALSHLIGTHVYVYSDNRLILFSEQMIEQECNTNAFGSIYLHHQGQTHYDVVTSVSSQQTVVNQESEAPDTVCKREYNKRMRERKRKSDKRHVLSSKNTRKDYLTETKKERKSERLLAMKKLRYRTDAKFKSETKERSMEKYWNNEIFRSNAKQRNLRKYKVHEEHRLKMKQKSIEKYKTNEQHRQRVMNRSKQKYKGDELHRKELKNKSAKKYRKDETHRENKKRMSIEKYKLNSLHRENVKKKSIEKYRTDETHRLNLKRRNRAKYQTNDIYKDSLKTRGMERYKNDILYRERIQRRCREKYKLDRAHKEKTKSNYHFNLEKKNRKNKNVSKHKQQRKQNLAAEEELVALFKSMVKQGPEYTCCCCHRLMFQNQVKRCLYNTYTTRQ